MDTITADMVKVNLLAIGAVFLILLLMKLQLLLPLLRRGDLTALERAAEKF